jgi:hypothetical protein
VSTAAPHARSGAHERVGRNTSQSKDIPSAAHEWRRWDQTWWSRGLVAPGSTFGGAEVNLSLCQIVWSTKKLHEKASVTVGIMAVSATPSRVTMIGRSAGPGSIRHLSGSRVAPSWFLFLADAEMAVGGAGVKTATSPATSRVTSISGKSSASRSSIRFYYARAAPTRSSGVDRALRGSEGTFLIFQEVWSLREIRSIQGLTGLQDYPQDCMTREKSWKLGLTPGIADPRDCGIVV